MDNFTMTVRSEGRDGLAHAIALAFANAPGGKATDYVVRPTAKGSGVQSLLLCWHADEEHKTQPLPYPLDAKTAVEFVDNWLAAQGPNRLDPYIDDDVENGDGAWVVEVGAWGHGGGSHFGVVLVTPCYAWYGK